MTDHAAAREPEERLESLRFFAQEDAPPSVMDWMQEVERQIAGLRKWLASVPQKKEIRW